MFRPLEPCLAQIQGDQLNTAVCLWYLVKSDLSSVLYTYTVAYTGLITFSRYQKNTDMFNWVPCIPETWRVFLALKARHFFLLIQNKIVTVLNVKKNIYHIHYIVHTSRYFKVQSKEKEVLKKPSPFKMKSVLIKNY